MLHFFFCCLFDPQFVLYLLLRNPAITSSMLIFCLKEKSNPLQWRQHLLIFIYYLLALHKNSWLLWVNFRVCIFSLLFHFLCKEIESVVEKSWISSPTFSCPTFSPTEYFLTLVSVFLQNVYRLLLSTLVSSLGWRFVSVDCTLEVYIVKW